MRVILAHFCLPTKFYDKRPLIKISNARTRMVGQKSLPLPSSSKVTPLFLENKREEEVDIEFNEVEDDVVEKCGINMKILTRIKIKKKLMIRMKISLMMRSRSKM